MEIYYIKVVFLVSWERIDFSKWLQEKWLNPILYNVQK